MCLRILSKNERAHERYESLEEARHRQRCEKFKNLTTSLILLPLQKSRESVEDMLQDFVEIQLMFDPEYCLDWRFQFNLNKLENEVKNPKQFYQYLG